MGDSVPNEGGDEMDADLKISRKVNRIIEQVKDGFKNINLHLISYCWSSKIIRGNFKKNWSSKYYGQRR